MRKTPPTVDIYINPVQQADPRATIRYRADVHVDNEFVTTFEDKDPDHVANAAAEFAANVMRAETRLSQGEIN